MADFNSITEMIESCATEAVQTARERFGFSLDYSEESIQSLETILANISAGMDVSNKEATERTVKLWGSYLGEVVRRSFGGGWDLLQYPGHESAVPTLVIAGSQLYPMVKIYRRLTMGDAENVWKFYEQIRTKLSLSPPATESING